MLSLKFLILGDCILEVFEISSVAVVMEGKNVDRAIRALLEEVAHEVDAHAGVFEIVGGGGGDKLGGSGGVGLHMVFVAFDAVFDGHLSSAFVFGHVGLVECH